jgi:phosphoribosylaminoimidazole-succinocarboxamide synthase
VSQPPEVLYESQLNSLPLICRGKVRDLYEINAQHLLMVATDRLSAFDVVLPTPIPGKGLVLTAVSNFWFRRTGHIIANHLQLAQKTLEEALPEPGERDSVTGRATVVRKLTALPLEAIVRGYLIGSGWSDYQRSGTVCDIELPKGLRLAEQLPEPLYTPSTKAAAGTHDENVDFTRTVALLGRKLAEQLRAMSLRLYQEAADFARTRGIIIADTKFEFGLDDKDRLVLIDELLTPDSSRFWPADQYQPGRNPTSFDKQFVRDYLNALNWNKKAPAPPLPSDIVAKTAAKYREAQRRLTR